MDYNFLCKTRLFANIEEKSVCSMLECLSATTKDFSKSEVIYHAGQDISSLGLILSGSANIEHIDYNGERTVISHISAGHIFGEAYACLDFQPLLVDVVSSDKTSVLFLDVSKLVGTCQNSCSHHTVLIRNLLAISSQKNLSLSQRMFHTSFKTLRAKLLSYLTEQKTIAQSNVFTIPFNRQQLADYLCADRSALCSEIGKMKRDGLITVEKNTFTLLSDEEM